MLLGNKQYNLFLPYFFHAEMDKKNDPEAAFIYSKDLLSEGADLMTLNCFLGQRCIVSDAGTRVKKHPRIKRSSC